MSLYGHRAIRRLVYGAVASSLVATAGAAVGASEASAAPEPVPGYSLMGPPPEGANDWSCKPTRKHPRPVVLVHGTGIGMVDTFSALAPKLAEEGYCVFALNYGAKSPGAEPKNQAWGTTDLHESAQELGRFIDAVLHATGTRKVDIVGHSQGGMLPRVYMKYHGGTNPIDPRHHKVASLIGIAPTNHGTTFNGQQTLLATGARFGVLPAGLVKLIYPTASTQQMIGSPLLEQLNTPIDTLPGVEYTVIASRTDNVVTPPEGSFLTPGDDVSNIWLQDSCPSSTADHITLLTDPQTIWLTLGALDPAYKRGNPKPCKA